MVSWWTMVSFYSLLLLVLIPSASSQTGCGCSQIGAVDNDCDAGSGQCSCKIGVGGLPCDACLPGYTGFNQQGCSLQCGPRVTGEECDTCSFRYRDFNRGCTPCPACFNRVANLFNQTLELYRQLLAELNSTLQTGGIDPVLLARVQEYRRMLEELLLRATNAIMREEELSSEHSALEMQTTSLGDVINDFFSNLTAAESSFGELQDRVATSLSAHGDLERGVADLERVIQLELRALLEEARRLNQDLGVPLERLSEVSSEADVVSFELQLVATSLVENATLTLNDASLALQRLFDTIDLQEQVQVVLRVLIINLGLFEDQAEAVVYALDNATLDVPIAQSEASRALAAILDVSLDSLDPESRQREVATLESEVSNTGNLVNETSSFLEAIRSNFSALNTSALETLTRSQELNIEAGLLLNRSRAALSLANDSAAQGNRIITEAEEILRELRRRLSDARNLSSGLDEVIRNVEMAENLSLSAEQRAQLADKEVREIADNVNTTMDLLDGVSEMLSDTMVVASQLNSRGGKILSNATSLNTSTAELADEITMATSKVDQLQQTVEDDKAAVAVVSRAANDAVDMAADLRERIVGINAALTNLTRELNETELLPSGRLQEVTEGVDDLESLSDQNQVKVDMLTTQIERLQSSASELRERYLMLRQHRDLLQEILSNVEGLDCREQFQDFS